MSLRDLRKHYPSVAEEFENFSLDIMSVVAEDERDVNELFVRLNRSKALTGAEVRNAIAGPVTDVIRKLSEHSIFKDIIRFSTKRAGDHNAAAKILLFEYVGTPVGTKKSNLDDFARDSKINKKKLELSARRVLDTLDAMAEVFLPSDELLSSAGVFPVYFWLVRNTQPIYYDDVRLFLIEFESERKAHRERQKDLGPSADVDQQFARYDTLNRSTNDPGSHRGRYEILKAGFSEFLGASYNLKKDPPFIKEVPGEL